jgi:hypothetical protein
MRFRFPSALLFSALMLSLTSASLAPVYSQARGQGASAIGYANTRVMREVNRQIDDVTKDFGCQGAGEKGYYEVRSRVAYAMKDIFSIYASASYFCGGPYPTNDANMSQTFDLRTGKQVQFEELFKNYEADKREILRAIFAAKVTTAERLKASGRAKEDDCRTLFALDNLETSSFSFNFSNAGLQVQPSWPHVIEACADRVTVPYSKLQRFAAPDGILARAAR